MKPLRFLSIRRYSHSVSFVWACKEFSCCFIILHFYFVKCKSGEKASVILVFIAISLVLYGQRSVEEEWQRDSEGGGGEGAMGGARRSISPPSWSVRPAEASRKVLGSHKQAIIWR